MKNKKKYISEVRRAAAMKSAAVRRAHSRREKMTAFSVRESDHAKLRAWSDSQLNDRGEIGISMAEAFHRIVEDM